MGSSPQINIPVGKHLLFFDGVCNLCNNSVDFIISRDPDHKFIFESLQSDNAINFIPTGLAENLNSIILRTSDGNWLYKSDAALFIASRLKGWPKYMIVFKWLPTFLRDFIYHLVAKNRYKYFGKMDSCRIPTPELRLRFLDAYQNK